MTDKYEDDIHNVTSPRLADMLEEIADGAEKAFGQIDNEEVFEIAKHENTILKQSAKRLRIPPHRTFHEEYMGKCL
jgi:hypothetical protein